MIIAIDGPSGAGKSSVSKDVAGKLGFSTLDTGAMFRAVAYAADRDGVDFQDEETLAHIAQTEEISFTKSDDSPAYKDIYIGNECITDAIRTGKIDKAVTPVCKHSAVRSALLEQQRNIASKGNYVIDGRDIGTVVFPNAELKIYLDAAPEERARRRVEQNKCSNNGPTDYEEVLADLNRRDYEDSHREVAPLRQADDAILIDSTNMTQDEVVQEICSRAKALLEVQE